jgi:hypothetical protein
MSLRTIQRLTMMSVLALAAVGASGCDDEETTGGDTDAGGNGGNGNGGNGNGGEDAGKDAGGDGDLMCGTPAMTCQDGPPILGALDLPACCAEKDGKEVCGVDGTLIPMLDSLHDCQPRDLVAMGEAPLCDQILNAVNKGINPMTGMATQPGIMAAQGVYLNLVGCCVGEGSATGTCGVATNNVLTVDMTGKETGTIDLAMGCVPFEKFATLVPATVPDAQNPFKGVKPCSLPVEEDAGSDAGN